MAGHVSFEITDCLLTIDDVNGKDLLQVSESSCTLIALS